MRLRVFDVLRECACVCVCVVLSVCDLSVSVCVMLSGLCLV